MSLFGKKIQDLRHAAELTLQQVAIALDLKVSFVSDVEHGRKKPFAPEQLFKFASITGGDFKELQHLASQERDSIEITIRGNGKKLSDLAYALARSANSGDTTELMEEFERFKSLQGE